VLYWPKVDQWPPSREVAIAAAILTYVVCPIALLLGAVGKIIIGAIVFIFLILGANARLKRMGAEEFWQSRPDD
jgi:hypothetical protein